jgi:hypothetical protein
MRFRSRARALAGAGIAALLIAVGGPAQPASAAPSPINLTGTTKSHLAALIQSDISFESTFDGNVDLATKAISGDFSTGPGTLKFNALGLLPVETGVQLHFTEPVTGTVDLATLKVDVEATFEIELTSFTLLGIPFLDPAQTCETVSEVTAPLTGTFSPTTGIVLTGTYTIPAFQNCGFLNDWITLFTAGPNHTIESTLTP